MAFPNKHYFSVDLSKFPKSVGGADRNDEVFLPVDKPSGYITSTMGRKDLRAKLQKSGLMIELLFSRWNNSSIKKISFDHTYACVHKFLDARSMMF